MLEERSPQAFHDDPRGAFVAGQHWFYFCIDDDLYGYVIWGRPDPDDIRTLVALLVRELRRPLHHALVDLAALEFVAPEAFEALAAYTVEHRADLARIVRHTAIVRPSGVNGAIVSGFFEVSTQPFPISIHVTPVAALEALGRADAASAAAALAELRQRLQGEPALLRHLRSYLAAHLAAATLDGAARELGVASRTLQRHMTAENTSFEDEVQQARVRAAELRLSNTDEPITNIALDLGFATPQHFATVFRKRTGHTPSAVRARGRSK
jgi:AraC-like DNA-binding protein